MRAFVLHIIKSTKEAAILINNLERTGIFWYGFFLHVIICHSLPTLRYTDIEISCQDHLTREIIRIRTLLEFTPEE